MTFSTFLSTQLLLAFENKGLTLNNIYFNKKEIRQEVQK